MFQTHESNVYKYDGFWLYGHGFRFTVTKTTFNKKGFNVSFKDHEYNHNTYFTFLRDNWYSDNIFINDIEFSPLDNITPESEGRLFLDDEVIKKFLDKNR